MTQPLVYTIRETAACAGVPVAFVRRMVKEGNIHAVRSGNRFYVTWASVERFLLGENNQIDAGRKNA